MVKDYWVYQKRDIPTPWALYIVKEWDKRKPSETTVLDFTLYHEDIPSPTHSISIEGIHSETVSGFVDECADFIAQHVGVTKEDKEQLRYSIENIVLH